MRKIFPAEIAEYTAENYFVKRNVTSRIVYITIISGLFILIALLPFIKIDLSTQSRGTVRSVYDNNTIQSVVSSEIRKICLHENLSVKEGDTLIWLKTDAIEEQIRRLYEKQEENKQFISDLNFLLKGEGTTAISSKYKSEYSHFLSKLNEQNISITQIESEYLISQKLYEKGVESRFDYDQNEKKYQLSKSQMSSIKQEFINNW